MLTICDTHILLFWADQPDRLSSPASANVVKLSVLVIRSPLWKRGVGGDFLNKSPSIPLFQRGKKLNLTALLPVRRSIQDILTDMSMAVLPITAEIAELSQSDLFIHSDPADRIIGATAMVHRAQLVTADEKLRVTPGLKCVW